MPQELQPLLLKDHTFSKKEERLFFQPITARDVTDFLINEGGYLRVATTHPGSIRLHDIRDGLVISSVLAALHACGLRMPYSQLEEEVTGQLAVFIKKTHEHGKVDLSHSPDGENYSSLRAHKDKVWNSIQRHLSPVIMESPYTRLIRQRLRHIQAYYRNVVEVNEGVMNTVDRGIGIPESLKWESHYMAFESESFSNTIVQLQKLLSSHAVLQLRMTEELLTGGSDYFLSRCGLQVGEELIAIVKGKYGVPENADGLFGQTFAELMYRYTYKVDTTPELTTSLAGRTSHIPPYQIRDLHHLGLPLAFIEWACYQAKRPLSGHAQIRPFVRVFSIGSISGALLPEDNVGNREEIINVHNFLVWVFNSDERVQRYLACRRGFGSTTEYLREYLLPKVDSYMRKDIDNYSVDQPAPLDYANEQSPKSFESFVAIIEQALSEGYLISPLMDWKIYDPELQSVYGIPRHIVLIQGRARDGRWIVYDPARPRSSKHSCVEPIHIWKSLSNGRFNVLGLVSR